MVFDTCFLLCFLMFLKKVMVQILGGTQTLSRVVDALGGDTDASLFLQHELIKLVPKLARPGQHPWVHGHTVDRDQLALVGRKATAIQRLASRHHLLVYFSGFNQETRQELGSHACCTFHGWRGRSPEALQWRVWRLPSCVWILSGTDSFFLHVGCTGCATPMGTSALIFPPIAGIGPTSIYFQSIIVVVILMLIMVMVTITRHFLRHLGSDWRFMWISLQLARILRQWAF